LNATALYQILTSQPNALNIASFDGYQIDSIDFARSNSAAVMNSILDLNLVNEICESHRLAFVNRIMINPGFKTARLLGTRKASKTAQEELSSSSLFDRILQNSSIVDESKKKYDVLKAEVNTLQGNLKTFQNDVKKLLKTNEPLKLSEEIKTKKIGRKKSGDEKLRCSMLDEIQLLKDKRFIEYQKIQTSQKAISDTKQSIHFKRMAMRFYHPLRSSTTSTKEPEKRKILSKDTLGLFKAHECDIQDPSAFVFSGTDNGLVNMSTTAAFSPERFKFHLNLYNRYQVLGEEIVDEDDSGYYDLPKTSVINAADVDVGCGYRKIRRKLEKQKKSTLEGKAILEAEQLLSRKPLDNSLTIPRYLENKESHIANSKKLRLFYGSTKRAIESRTLEIQKQKFSNKLVAREKKFIKEAGKKIIEKYKR
jgi:hypothetical protein